MRRSPTLQFHIKPFFFRPSSNTWWVCVCMGSSVPLWNPVWQTIQKHTFSYLKQEEIDVHSKFINPKPKEKRSHSGFAFLNHRLYTYSANTVEPFRASLFFSFQNYESSSQSYLKTQYVKSSRALKLNASNLPLLQPLQKAILRFKQLYVKRATSIPYFLLPITNFKHQLTRFLNQFKPVSRGQTGKTNERGKKDNLFT